MPLNKPALDSALTELFTSPPDTFAGCAQAWADALESYAIAVVPASTTVSAAAEVLSATLISIFSANTVTGSGDATAASMEAAFATFAATVALGMVPAYTGNVPVGNVGFSALFGVTRNSALDAALAFSSAIDTWMRTGTATLNSPPATTVNWN